MLKASCNSSKYLPAANSVSSHIISPRTLTQNQQLQNNKTAYNKFIDFISNQNISLLTQKLLQFRGTHYPINYKKQFNVQERWQKIIKSTEEVNFNLLMSSSQICYAFSFILMIFNFILIWFLSVFRLYQIRDCQSFFQIAIIFNIGDVLLKIYLYTDHYSTCHETVKLQKILFSFDFISLTIGDLWCLIYYICILADTEISNIHENSMLIFDLFTVIFLVKRAYEIYNYLVILVVATKYKNEMTIFDLVIKMLIILHFFAMVLYFVAMTSPDSNWMTRISMDDNHWSTKYIYTLYFACTTMFTVGYGDILPTNKAEIITIMFIEALGMALFGYIVNEVGAALGNMKKKRANLEKDIFNAQRISKYYELCPDLGKKIRDYVISNQIAQQELGVSQENDFLLKLNEELRNQVKESHQLKIIKTSMFFITHWSKKIQIEMAKKLQKCIFAPNQNVHSNGEVQKLYILVKGKIQVFTQRSFGTKICCRKLLKTIQKLPGQQVFSNVFGYTSFFSGKANRLKAVAKDSTVCYTVGYADIRDSINQDSNDFEYFHELRQKFQFSKNSQKWQTPNIINIRENYSPIIYYVIKKYTKSYRPQARQKGWSRKQYINKRICQFNALRNQSQTFEIRSARSAVSHDSSFSSQDNMDDKIQCMVSDYLHKQNQQQSQVYSSNYLTKIEDRNDQIIQQTPNAKRTQKFIQYADNSTQLITNRSYRRKYWFANRQGRYQEKAKQFLEENPLLTSEFQIGKNYNRFFLKCNKAKILERLSKKPEMIRNDFGSFSKKMLKSSNQVQKRSNRRNFSEMFKNQDHFSY